MKKLLIPLCTLALVSSAFAATSTTKSTDTKTTTTSTTGTTQNADTTMTPKSDAEIVNMLMTVNTEEMNLSKLGKKKAENKKVKEFADMMMKTHAENNDKAAALRREQKIELTETKPSNKVKTTVEGSIENLETMSGKQFDKAFMDAQVVLHQKALRDLDNKLIPNTKNAQLKTMLQETKGHVESHLKQAQDILTSVQ